MADASDKVFEGFWVGCMNKRGIHSRGAYEGGDQRSDLAAEYRRHGIALDASHPQLAAAALSIADYYDRHGLFEDVDPLLRQKGHQRPKAVG